MDIKGSIPITNEANAVLLRKGQTYNFPSPNLEPKERKFVGYVPVVSNIFVCGVWLRAHG
jgi:hypothetical protein